MLAQRLGDSKALVVSGGGPGAMEAAHLGALLAGKGPTVLDDAIQALCAQPRLPEDLMNVVQPDGSVRKDVAAAMHAWLCPAVHLWKGISDPAASLSFPTWYYGYELSSPFATNIGKYFQNSVREDGLVTVGTSGIVFVEGRAGTLQEVFQNAATNYYRSKGTRFIP